jgi:hypothetical protein
MPSRPAEDALSGALMNAGPIIHPPLIVMNAGPIEHFDHWDIHNEGTQPSVRRVTTRLDAERMAVRDALGYGAPHFPLADHYDNDADEWMYGNMAHDRLVDSGDWRERLVLTDHRYMREDVEIGLAFLVSVADWAGVPAPTATGLLAIGSAICEADFRTGARTLDGLGLAAMDPAALQAMLERGAGSEVIAAGRRGPDGARHGGGLCLCRPRGAPDRRQAARRRRLSRLGRGRRNRDPRHPGAAGGVRASGTRRDRPDGSARQVAIRWPTCPLHWAAPM